MVAAEVTRRSAFPGALLKSNFHLAGGPSPRPSPVRRERVSDSSAVALAKAEGRLRVRCQPEVPIENQSSINDPPPYVGGYDS